MIKGGLQGPESMSAEESSVPLVPVRDAGGGDPADRDRPVRHARRGRSSCRPGFVVALAYVAIWMFNGKRSHSLIGVLATVCAFYITRLRRPSWPVLFATSFAGALVVAIAIGWRNNTELRDRRCPGSSQYLADFDPRTILESLNIEDAGGRAGSTSDPRDRRVRRLPADDGHGPREVGVRLRRQLHPHRLHVHPPDRLARQAALRPRAVGGRLDRRLGDQARRGLHRPGDRHPRGDPAQRRRRGDR